MKAKKMKTPLDKRPFGARDKFGYMMGDFGCNMSFQLIGTYLITFASQVLHIGEWWSLIVIISKIFDAINDPIIGAIVDARKPGKRGKYLPWIFFGSFAIAITTVLLFINVSAFPTWGKVVYVTVMYCIWSVAYTAANVPYGSLNAALTDDAGQRSSLSAFRGIGAGIAMLPLTMIIPKLIYGEPDPVTGIETVKGDVFVWIALVCGIVGIGGFMLTCFLTKERKQVEVKQREKFNYLETLKGFVKNRGAMGMCLASFSQLVFIMTYSVTLPIVCQYFFKDAGNSGTVSIVMMLPMAVFIPIMGKISKKFGKRELSLWPNLFAMAVLVIMLFIPFPATSGGMWMYAIFLGISMIASTPLNLGTWSMVADCVDEQEVKTSKKDGKNLFATYLTPNQFGKRDEASVYATYSLARKAAQGVGSALVLALARSVGYVDNVAEAAPEAGANILQLSIILPLVGTVLIFLSFLLVHNLDKKKVEDNTEFLRSKNERLAIQAAHGPQPDDGTDEAEVISFETVVEVEEELITA